MIKHKGKDKDNNPFLHPIFPFHPVHLQMCSTFPSNNTLCLTSGAEGEVDYVFVLFFVFVFLNLSCMQTYDFTSTSFNLCSLFFCSFFFLIFFFYLVKHRSSSLVLLWVRGVWGWGAGGGVSGVPIWLPIHTYYMKWSMVLRAFIIIRI